MKCLIVFVCVCVILAEASVKPVFKKEEKAVEEKENVGQTTAMQTGRTFSEMYDEFWRMLGYGDYDYNYYDYNEIDGAHSSSYSSYQPARDDDYDYLANQYLDETETSWADIMTNAAMVLVPLGILLSLAPLPFGVYTIALRRSFDDSWFGAQQVDTTTLPLLKAIETTDIVEILPELATRPCQEKLFCELSILGQKNEGSYGQKALYYASVMTPKFFARRFGVKRLFDISKNGQCERITCSLTNKEQIEGVPAISDKLETPENNSIKDSSNL